MKKRPFVLFEALIAICLLIFFVPVLIKLPIHHYRSQIKHFESLEKQRISDWTFSEIKEALLCNSIPWKALPEKNKEAKLFPLSDITLRLPGLEEKPLKRSFTLKCKSEKEGKKGEIFRLYRLEISIEKSVYEYLLLIQLV